MFPPYVHSMDQCQIFTLGLLTSSTSSCYNSNDALYILHYTDLPWKNLQPQQNSADWQFDKELDVTEKHLGEKELLSLMEMDHHSKGGAYYQYINEELLEIVKNANILEILNVDIETNGIKNSQNRKHSFTSRELSVVDHLIESVLKASSAQVSCF